MREHNKGSSQIKLNDLNSFLRRAARIVSIRRLQLVVAAFVGLWLFHTEIIPGVSFDGLWKTCFFISLFLWVIRVAARFVCRADLARRSMD